MKKSAVELKTEPDEAAPGAKPLRGLWVILGVVVAAALAIGLYQAKTEALQTRKRIASLEQELRETRRAISAREAEIAYLERPERLREIARSKLNLAPVKTDHLKSLDDLEESAEQKSPADKAAPVDN